MNVRIRLLAQFRQDEPIELQRAGANSHVTEGSIRALTENMNHEWRHWLETPMHPKEAIGRVERHVPSVGRPKNEDLWLLAESLKAEDDDAPFNPGNKT